MLENYQLLELSPAMQSKATAQAASTEQLLYGILTTRGEDEGAEPVMVMVDATITPINTTVETLRAQLVIITVIMTAFSILLVLLLSSMISRPITRITKSAKQLATVMMVVGSAWAWWSLPSSVCWLPTLLCAATALWLWRLPTAVAQT